MTTPLNEASQRANTFDGPEAGAGGKREHSVRF